MDATDKTGHEQAQRAHRGRFAPGKSGNPAGRPRGSRSRVSRGAQDLLDNASDAVIGKVIELAKLGDRAMLRLCVDRIVPRRDRVIEIPVPVLQRASDIAGAAGGVIQMAAAGELTLAEAREFLVLLDLQRQALETTELEVRLDAIERAQEPGAIGRVRRTE